MKYRCDGCGIESEIEQFFIPVKKLLSRKTRRYCPNCWEKSKQREVRNLGIELLLLIPLGVIYWALQPESWAALVPIKIALTVILITPMVLLHELSHALVSRSLGLRVFSISMGFGRTLFSRRVHGIDWEIRSIPLGGYTAIGSPPVAHYRLKIFFTYLAGPAAHIILLILFQRVWLALALSQVPMALSTSRLVYESSSYYVLNVLIDSLIYTNLFLLISALLPSRGLSPYGQLSSDGVQLFKIPRLTDAELRERFVSYYVMECVWASRQGEEAAARRWVELGLEKYPDAALLLNGLGYVLTHAGEYAQARPVFVKLLATAEAQKPALRAILLNNIAYCDLMLEDPGLLPEADQYSSEAYQMNPWQPPIVGTRGAVLAELGQYDQGIQLLKEAMTRQDNAGDKANSACHLAIAEARRACAHGSDPTAARLYLDSARKLNPKASLLPRAEAEIYKFGMINESRGAS